MRFDFRRFRSIINTAIWPGLAPIGGIELLPPICVSPICPTDDQDTLLTIGAGYDLDGLFVHADRFLYGPSLAIRLARA